MGIEFTLKRSPGVFDGRPDGREPQRAIAPFSDDIPESTTSGATILRLPTPADAISAADGLSDEVAIAESQNDTLRATAEGEAGAEKVHHSLPARLERIRGRIKTSPDLRQIVTGLIEGQKKHLPEYPTALPALFGPYAEYAYRGSTVTKTLGTSVLPEKLVMEDEDGLNVDRYMTITGLLADTIALAEIKGDVEAQQIRKRAISLLDILDADIYNGSQSVTHQSDTNDHQGTGINRTTPSDQARNRNARPMMVTTSLLGRRLDEPGYDDDTNMAAFEVEAEAASWLDDKTATLIATVFEINDELNARLPEMRLPGDVANALRGFGRNKYYFIDATYSLHDSDESGKLGRFRFGLDVLRAELSMIAKSGLHTEEIDILNEKINLYYETVTDLLEGPITILPAINRARLVPASQQGKKISELSQELMNVAEPGSFTYIPADPPVWLTDKDHELVQGLIQQADPNVSTKSGEELVLETLRRFETWTVGNQIAMGLVEVPVELTGEILAKMCSQLGITYDPDKHDQITDHHIGSSYEVNMLTLHTISMEIAKNEGLIDAFKNRGVNNPEVAAVVTAALGTSIQNSSSELSAPGAVERGLNWADIQTSDHASGNDSDTETSPMLLDRLAQARARLYEHFPGNTEYAENLARFGRTLVLNAQEGGLSGIPEIDPEEGVAKTGQTGLILGATGTGKTYALERIGDMYGVHTVVVDMSVLVPEGIRGERISDAAYKAFVKKAKDIGVTFQEFCRLAEEGKVLVVLDEARKFLVGIKETSDGSSEMQEARNQLGAELRKLLGDEDKILALTQTEGSRETTHGTINTRNLHFVLSSSLTGAPEEQAEIGRDLREQAGEEAANISRLLVDVGLQADTIGRIKDNVILVPDVTIDAIRATWNERTDSSNPKVHIQRVLGEVLRRSDLPHRIAISEEAAELFLAACGTGTGLRELGWRHADAIRDRVITRILDLLETNPKFAGRIQTVGGIYIGKNLMGAALRTE